uniref:A-kinase anchoring protein 9 n=1 Tax=Callorhinchus milii TaxID=7868 RepID=A0A4W3K030_CALMI
MSETRSEHDTQPTQTRLETMEEELTAKQQEIEELSRELEELRGLCGTEGLQQLQEFETAVKQRDGIITQLTANLQQARKEKDEIRQEFLDLTDQSQKLQIQFQQLQAGETLRNTSHGTTAVDLLQAKQQLITYQQQIDDLEQQMKTLQTKNEEHLDQINLLQIQLQERMMIDKEKSDTDRQKLQNQDQIIEQLEKTLKEHESTILLLKDKVHGSDKFVKDLHDQLLQRNQETESLRTELTNSKQRERQSSNEIKQLMGSVEALQKQYHKGSQADLETVQRIEIETHRKMEQLQAELDEMYGKQIVQMKQELQQQHISEIGRLTEQHNIEMERALNHSVSNLVNEEQITLLNVAINELNIKLREAHFQKDQVRQEMTQQLERLSKEKIQLQNQIQDLLVELRFAKDQIQKTSESINYQEHKMREMEELKDVIEQMKAQLLSASEAHRELESKHESEVTNYKIKLEMLEREKVAVLDRMAESQEAELDRLRTQLLFSHEEELVKLREDLEREHKLNIDNLKEDLSLKQTQQLENLQNELGQKNEVITSERDCMIIEKNQLMSEITILKEELHLSLKNSKVEEMVFQISELEMEIDTLRKDEKEKGMMEQELQELQDRNNILEKQLKQQEAADIQIKMLQEGKENLVETNEMRRHIERLIRENEQLQVHEKELKEEIERQRNTFSFAEKNFEVNFQELQDEYDCLLKMKSDIEEKMIKQEIEYETKLKILNEQLQLLELKQAENRTVMSKGKKKTLHNSKGQFEMIKTLESREFIEKDSTELMEKLELAQQEKSELSKRLSNLSELLTLRQSEIEQLKSKLKSIKEYSGEKCEETKKIITAVQVKSQEKHRVSHINLIKTETKREPQEQAVKDCAAELCELYDHEQQKGNLMDQISSLQNSLQVIALERDEIKQNQINLIREKEVLLTQIQHFKDKPVSESVASLQAERDRLRQQLESVRAQQLGMAELVQQKTLLEETLHKKQEEMENILIVAQQEKLELEKKIAAHIGGSVSAHDPVLEKTEVKDAQLEDSQRHKEQEVEVKDAQLEKSQRHREQEIEAEIRLHLEAQRISLTQIHAAQLELTCDGLKTEKARALDSLQEKLTASHTLEVEKLHTLYQQQLQDLEAHQKGSEESSETLINKLNEKISIECMELTQSFTNVLDEDYLAKKKGNKEQTKEALEFANADLFAKEDYKKQRDPTDKARAIQTKLQMFHRKIVEEYSRLKALQIQLIDDRQQIEDLQAAYVNLQLRTEEETASFQIQIESARASSGDLNDLKEQLQVRSARLQEIEKLKQEFNEQQAQLTEQHIQEIENLRATHEQQCKETEEKYTADILGLQQELQKVTASIPQSRSEVNVSEVQMADICAVGDVEQQHSEELMLDTELDSTFEQQWLMKRPHLARQMEILKKTLYAKYIQKISNLKEQHKQELNRMEAMLSKQYLEDMDVFEKETTKLPEESIGDQDLHKVMQPVNLEEITEQKDEPLHIIQLLEKQHEEHMHEEIAKVIVQMSVGFAQQTELARINSNLQEEPARKLSEEELEKEMEQRMDTLKQDLQCQFEADRKTQEARFSAEKEELERILKQKNEELATVERRLQNYTVKHELEMQDVVSGTALREEFVKANQGLQGENQAKDIFGLNEISFENKSECIHLESPETEKGRKDSDFERVYQERLEDMRQEFVRQDQEHQQTVEALRQSHTQQLERLQEEQEQLLTEIGKLKAQLAESDPVCNEILVSENERMLAELETFKQLHVTGKEVLPQEMCNNSTQTDKDDTEVRRKSEEQSSEPESYSASQGKFEELNSSVLARERNCFQEANERLLKVLSEIAKTTVAAEETISRHVSALIQRASRAQSSRSSMWERAPQESGEPQKSFLLLNQGAGGEKLSDSYHDSEGGDDSSMWSGGTDEGLELSQHFTQSIFSGAELDPDNEECVLNVGTRLQAALEKLLEAITEIASQLDHARVTQTELVRDSIRKKEELADLRKHQEEVTEQLSEETKAREQLALALHKAEGLIDGYTDEKAKLEEQFREKAEIQHQLEQELQHTSSRLHELEEERQQLQQERELITRQQDAMKESAGTVELQLLEETEKLMKEKREVQRQAEKEQGDFAKQVKMLESELEEQVNKSIELEQEKKVEILDLQQQIVALEKQLEKNRKFLDEQAIDREQERDVFQHEIQKLEQQLKTPQRLQPITDQRNREIAHLSDQLKDKTDRCSELLLAKEQLQRDVQERNEEMEKLENRIRELEQALIISTDPIQKVEERKPFATIQVKGGKNLETQLQAEREALERKAKEISNLEEQLEQFREELLNKHEEVQQLHMQLEIQRKESGTRLQEAQQEHSRLQNEVESLQQSVHDSSESSGDGYRSSARRLSQTLKEKDQEIEHLNEQLIKLQQQLHITSHNKVIEGKDTHIRELEAQIECLKSDQVCLKKSNEEEVEQLNDVIEKLQQELTKIIPAPEDAENFKAQLCVITGEKAKLQQQMDKGNEDMHHTQKELEELKCEMLQTTQELQLMKTEHSTLLEKYRNMQTQGAVNPGAEILEKGTSEQMIQEKPASFLVSEDGVKPVEHTKDLKGSADISIQALQAAIEKRDRELEACYQQIQNLREQIQTEAQGHEKQVLELEEAIREKVATVLVSQAQLKAVQQQVNSSSAEPLSQIKHGKNIDGVEKKSEVAEPSPEESFKEKPSMLFRGSEDVDQGSQQNLTKAAHVEDQATEDVMVLRARLTELLQQVTDLQKNLELERKLVASTQQEAAEKETKLIELNHKLLEMKSSTEQDPGRGSSKFPHFNEKEGRQLEISAQQSTASVVELVSELEQVKVDAALTKEELNNYRERTEKLQEDLQVKEHTISNLQEQLGIVKEALAQAEGKLGSFKQGVQQSSLKIENIDTDEPKSTLVKESPIKTLGTYKDAAVQTDLEPLCTSSSEDTAEIRRQCSEKIGQLQDLHAAEITNMETRHSAETEALKKEYAVQVEALRELGAVKTVISSSREGHLDSQAPTGRPQLRDSDGSSEGSQGAYFDISPEGQEYRNMPEGTKKESNMLQIAHTALGQGTEKFPDKIKTLLREVHQEGMQVLSLTELPFVEGPQQLLNYPDVWLQERRALLDLVQSLKDVVSKTKGSGETKGASPESITDWRQELLQAVQAVFDKEHDVLIASLHAQSSSLSPADAMTLMSLLQEQVMQRRADVEHLMIADRNSMMMEIRELWSYLHRMQQGETGPPTAEEQVPQRNLVELLEPNVQQKQSQILELQIERSALKEKGMEVQEQLNSEKMMVAELKNELSQTKLELETTLKAQHKHFKEQETLRMELNEKAAELDMVSDTLANEQKKIRELQWALEKEKCKLDRKEERDREQLEDLKLALDDQKTKSLQLGNILEQERLVVTELQQKLDSESSLHATELSHERRRTSELQIAMDAEKARTSELNSALERERQFCVQLQQSAEEHQTGVPKQSGRMSETLLRELQSQLEDKHDRIVELVSEMERYKLESVQLRQHLEDEQQIHKKAVLKEHETHRLLQQKVDALRSQEELLLHQLAEENQKVLKLQREEQRLQETILTLQEIEQERMEREAEKQLERDVALTEKDCQTANAWEIGLSTDRTRNWIIQQKLTAPATGKSAPVCIQHSYARSLNSSEVNGGDAASGENLNLENISQRMQMMISKLKAMGSKDSRSWLEPGTESRTAGDEDLIWLQNSIQDVVSQLQQLQASELPENIAFPPGGSTGTLTERLLRQNADLTGYVSKLTEEKNELRNSLLKLEEQVRKYRPRGSSSNQLTRRSLDNQDTIDSLIKSERTTWATEKAGLQQALKQAEAELVKMKAEARSEALQRSLFGSDSEAITIKRIYGKYLRAESFRKALVYQKKYLLLLLGGFQECEQATLSLIARMGGQPSYTSLQLITHRSRGFTRFRSAVRVSIAISRLRFLVRRWLRAAGSSGLTGSNRNGHSQVSGNEVTLLSPGGMSPESSVTRELFGDRRHCANRQRSGQESPRSTTNSQSRCQYLPADSSPGSFASSHLQSYDPDRALTDYINRLEALQRRLGSVQSSSTSYTQLHYGTRR